MKSSPFFSLLVAGYLLFLSGCTESSDNTAPETEYPYESVEGDPFDLRIYTLRNGLKVYISENHNEPRIQTNIAVRTGSKQDPADATGLAHYLEHMMFKGTSRLGSLNWEEEQKYLQMISDLYERHRATQNPEERKQIYHEIDSLSHIAATFVAPNEYDKLISALGAQGTNAYTSNERTVYINDIPGNELEKWLAIESERFNALVLRLFHTELEAVYEEYNRGQDSDGRQSYYKMLELLFPTHPYGQQTTIGKGEHLKNPSMVKIHEYFRRRYVPNNMAIVLAGDVNPDEAIKLVDKYFGKFERQPLENIEMPEEAPLTEPKVAVVTGSEAEFVRLGFRLDGADSKDALYLELFSGILSNGKAGLIDLNLLQNQKVLKASAMESVNQDYSFFSLSGYPRAGQSLDEVRELLLAQIDSVKQGRFEDWMIDAVVRKYKKDMMMQMEANWIRAYMITDAFILGQDWQNVITRYDRMQQITREELMAWANEKFGNNYVAVNKVLGEKEAQGVEKPEITPIQINREENSAFFTMIDTMASARMEPQFIDFQSAITKATVRNSVPLHYVHNDMNEVFYMYYVFDMGKNNNMKLPLAIDYLPYLGTTGMSPAQVQQELFKLGIGFEVHSSDEQAYVIVNGLRETFEEGVKFFEHLLNDVVADQNSYDEMVKGILKKRTDEKLNKNTILFRALTNYAMYGPSNPFNTILNESELKTTDPAELVDILRGITDHEHRILFYGPQDIAAVTTVLDKYHDIPASLKPVPEARKFEQLAMEENKVLFTEYNMVQAELMMLHRGPAFNLELVPQSHIFSEYFGAGLSSIVFQEIRESKALAYSAYAMYTTPERADQHHYVRGYIGTQANKLEDATGALLDLMGELPRAERQFEQSKISALKQIETNRTVGRNILWRYEAMRKQGIDYDINSKLYPAIEKMTMDDLQVFFDREVKDKSYTYMVIGKKTEMDMKALESLGPVKEVTLKQLFGY